MTAEIAIMNKSAVALAADSAVTFSRGDRQKIYNTVNKLFMLSKYHPVGVMIYGGAELVQVPWEIIIKMYRHKLRARSFDRLQDYVDDFLKFLEQPNGFFPDEAQEHYVGMAVSHLYHHIKEMINKVVKEKTSKGTLSESDVTKIVGEVIAAEFTAWGRMKSLDYLEPDFPKRVTERYGEIFEQRRDFVFQKLPFTADDLTKLNQLSASVFYKVWFNPMLETGLVFAGFGQSQIYPTVSQVSIEGVLLNRVKHSNRGDHSISFKNPAQIIPFAQTDMVFTFMEGVSPSYNRIVQSYLDEMFANYPGELLKHFTGFSDEQKKDLLEKLRKVGKDALSEFAQKLNEHRKAEHVIPVMNAMSGLPKDELAAVAESLVNLTSFKRRFSMDAETVGGAIDVAVISKGDGFVWIKRKHYFRPELNGHFQENYFRDYNHGKEGESHGKAGEEDQIT